VHRHLTKISGRVNKTQKGIAATPTLVTGQFFLHNTAIFRPLATAFWLVGMWGSGRWDGLQRSELANTRSPPIHAHTRPRGTPAMIRAYDPGESHPTK
jgi:hypothetical protein